MATAVKLRHRETGLTKTGYVGYSWTSLFWGGIPALFRGDILTGVLVTIAHILTYAMAGLLWAFFYNKSYTTKLIEKGYQLADSPVTNEHARKALGITYVEPRDD